MIFKYLLTLIFLIGIIGCGSDLREPTLQTTPSIKTDIDLLDKSDDDYFYALDGDTIKFRFDSKITTIRLIGIDTFEIHKNNKAYRQAYENNISLEEVIQRGKAAREFVINLLKEYSDYYFEYDEDFLDRYKRTLAYVWLDNKTMLNLKIVCSGYAMPLKIRPNTKYSSVINECYNRAKELKLGIWR